MTQFDNPVLDIPKIIDGDSQKIQIDLGYRTYLTIRTRLHGLDCPAMSTSAGRIVKRYVESWLDSQLPLGTMRWVSFGLDMYGRSLGEFRIPVLSFDPISLNSILLAKKYAKPYDGQHARIPWTQTELDYITDA